MTVVSAMLLLSILFGCATGVPLALQGPVFLQEPPHSVQFSSSAGVLIPCSAHGNPTPVVRWQTWEGAEAGTVPGLRNPLANGSLLLPAFTADQFRPGVHRTAYRCVARNAVGSAVSRRVAVTAVVSGQRYEAQVHDEFVVTGNTAVLRCHVPAFAREFVDVTGWLRGEPPTELIADVASGGRFSAFPWGELHIREAGEQDGHAGPYRCRTRHRLSGAAALSAPGRLVVTEARGSVAPRLTDTRSHVTARAKQPAELPCAAQAYPLPQYT
ncbi:Down syndrome cell adhesion molecule-like protein Dscam2 [Schistocerca gregaria]|uniref:Down syndrome cell adhesion molecule-like protein Dscam2 n=1 Tax=Schistocerca gregaria TaxID=7010 RepID=UPI00211E3757|nr:Down syndrome cell adhesion molecule-like protein Dscam2 [Schistocerca gregaria]